MAADDAGRAPELRGWQERAVGRTLGAARDRADRSIEAARERALERSQRFIHAATELVQLRGTDFTVQDVVARAKSSLRTFYLQFASKEDLLLAVFEDMVAIAADQLAAASRSDASKPEDQLRDFVLGLFSMVETTPSARTMVVYHLSLAEERPAEFRHALQPMLDHVTRLVTEVSAAGAIESTLEPARLATLLLNAVVMSIHLSLLTAGVDGDATTGEEMWAFCSTGLGLRSR